MRTQCPASAPGPGAFPLYRAEGSGYNGAFFDAFLRRGGRDAGSNQAETGACLAAVEATEQNWAGTLAVVR
jgi:hypothetical protein